MELSSASIHELFGNRAIKPKDRTRSISEWLIDQSITTDELIGFAYHQKAPVKATCMEALEYVTALQPQLATIAVFEFAANNLADPAPRVKWESARVISNIAPMFPDQLNRVVSQLLENATHSGTVVRWSAATALAQIACISGYQNPGFLNQLQALLENEPKSSIQKIYRAALKSVHKI